MAQSNSTEKYMDKGIKYLVCKRSIDRDTTLIIIWEDMIIERNRMYWTRFNLKYRCYIFRNRLLKGVKLVVID